MKLLKKSFVRQCCLLLCGILVAGCLFSASVCAQAAEKPAPSVRVLLRRLSLTDRIDLQLGCPFQAAWSGGRMLLPADKKLTVQIRQDRLILFYEEASLDCGTWLNLTRLGKEQEVGGTPVGLTILPWDGIYPGDLNLTVSGGQLQPVLTINVEDYLLGVVPYEMSDDFPLEALKAQAVCARTYALSRVDAAKAWDVVDTTNDQVFRPISASRVCTARAVQETAGIVVTAQGRLANCYYSASNGGQTELPGHVWSGTETSKCYAIVDDPYDLENPESILKKAVLRKNGSGLPEAFLTLLREAVFTRPEMAGYVQSAECFRVDSIRSLTLTGPRFDAPSRLMTRIEIKIDVSGRKYLPPETPEPSLTWEADEAEVSSTPQPAVTSEPELRLGSFEQASTFTLTLPLFPAVVRALGLSIYGADNEIITVAESDSAFQLTAGRYGHGVGMSQRGAQWMAGKYGKTFQDILTFYYPGSQLMKTSSGAAVLATPDPVLAETPGPAATATPRPTLMPVTEKLPEGAWMASVEGIEDDSTLNLRAEPSPAGEILMRLYKHQRLIVLETCEDPAWVHVKTDSIEGYVMVSFLEPVSE